MKYIFIAFILTFCLLVPLTFASEVENIESTEVYETEASESSFPESEFDPIVNEEIVRSVSPVTPNDTSGLKKILLQLFGSYDTIVTEHRYTNSSGYTSVSIDVQEDHPWLCSVAIFALVLYCVFRLIGGVMIGRR